MDMPCHYTPDVFIELIVAATEALAGCGLATKGAGSCRGWQEPAPPGH